MKTDTDNERYVCEDVNCGYEIKWNSGRVKAEGLHK